MNFALITAVNHPAGYSAGKLPTVFIRVSEPEIYSLAWLDAASVAFFLDVEYFSTDWRLGKLSAFHCWLAFHSERPYLTPRTKKCDIFENQPWSACEISSMTRHQEIDICYMQMCLRVLKNVAHLIEFFYNSLFSAKSWQNSASINGKKQNKNCSRSGLNPQSQDLHSNALPTELGRNMLGRRFLKWTLFVSCTTSHVRLWLFLESIEHDFIKAVKIQASNWMLT